MQIYKSVSDQSGSSRGPEGPGDDPGEVPSAFPEQRSLLFFAAVVSHADGSPANHPTSFNSTSEQKNLTILRFVQPLQRLLGSCDH